ncbi:MAG: PAS domain S-box protein [Methanoregulaceae archaeon]|nr:MAG: PAS domain S-box protein [Methanoregulaceae archaeon]
MISILYVDDEPGLLDLCRIFLEQTGEFRVDTADSGKEALAQLVKKHYDAIISDYQMPEMDGISLLKSIRLQDTDMPFILFTGRGREEVVIEAVNNGVDFYLQKGGDPKAQFAELMHQVRQAVNKRQVERNLHESEKRLTDIINFLPDPTFAIDREGKVIAWNRAIEDLTGVPAPEMLGKGDYEYAIPFYGHRRPILIDLIFEPDERIQEHYSGIRREKDILIAETDLPRPLGAQLTLMGKASPLYDRQGEITGAIESIRDITAHKQAEDELRAAYTQIMATDGELRDQYDKLSRNEQILKDSEEKYRTLVENSHDVIYIYRGDHFLLMNKRGSEITGYSHEELMQMRVWDLLHPDDLNRVFAAGVARMQGKNIPSRYMARIVTKYGGAIPMELVALLITFQGEPAIMGIARDVTERENYINGMARKTKTLTIMNRIIQMTSQKIDINELLTTALSSILDHLGFDGGAVYVINNQTKRARIECVQNLPAEYIREVDDVDIHGYPFNRVLERGEALIVENYEQSSPEFAKKYGFRSFASIPVMAEQLVIGALNVVSSRQSEISPDDREVLSAIGKELGSAITRLKAEAALQENEGHYRTLIETTGTGYVIIDDKGRVADANPEYVRLAGHTGLSEIKGRTVTEWTAPHDRQKNASAVRECLEKGVLRNFEVDYVDSSGKITPVEINASRINSQGSVRIVTLCRDITDRRKAEIALRQSENLYGTLADAAQDLIYIIDKDDTVAYVNTYGAMMIGRNRQDIIGRPRKTLFPGPEGERQYQNLRQVFSTGVSLHAEGQVHLPSRDTWQDTHLIPLKNPEGIITAVMGISRDITAMKQGMESLRRSESQYRSFIDNVQDVLYRTDMGGKLTMISLAGAKMAGYDSPEKMIGIDMAHDLYEDPQERKKFFSILARKGSVTAYPLVLKARDGRRYHVTASSQYFYDAQGNVLGIEGIIHDVTHLRQAEDALKEANRKLNLLNSITRHDVANQLTVLLGYTQLAMIKNPDPIIADFLQKIDSVATTIGRQIEFSKAYQELGVHAPGWFNLDDVFARTKPRDILFSSSCSETEIFADPMLEKVFANLFGNSVMHGERVSRITVRCEPAGDELLINVEDNGVGIPLGEKQNIFRKGYGKNTGFGLFLAREILAITKISIHETGRHGSGARFEIVVPKNGFRHSRGSGQPHV